MSSRAAECYACHGSKTCEGDGQVNGKENLRVRKVVATWRSDRYGGARFWTTLNVCVELNQKPVKLLHDRSDEVSGGGSSDDAGQLSSGPLAAYGGIYGVTII